MKRLFVILILLSFVMLPELHAQRVRYKPYWTVTTSVGPTLFFGDMSDSYKTVLHKYFDPEQVALGKSIDVRKRFLPYLGVNLKYTNGRIRGKRTAWSDGFPVYYNFEASINELSLIADVDLLDLLDIYKPWLSLYVKGGAGMVFYNSLNRNFQLDVDLLNQHEKSLVAPFGGGARIYLTGHFGIQFETTWNYCFSDMIDGYAATSTNNNDLYTFTSFGLIFKIPRAKRNSSFANKVVVFKDRKSFYLAALYLLLRTKHYLPQENSIF